MASRTKHSRPQRAIDAALSAKNAFRPHGVKLANRFTDRFVSRYAPSNVRRVGSLRSLAEADRVLSAYFTPADIANETTSLAKTTRGGQPASWALPSPWYRDEMEWVTASMRVHHAPDVAVHQSPRRGPVDVSFVAPSLAGSASLAATTVPFAPSISSAETHAARFLSALSAPMAQTMHGTTSSSGSVVGSRPLMSARTLARLTGSEPSAPSHLSSPSAPVIARRLRRVLAQSQDTMSHYVAVAQAQPRAAGPAPIQAVGPAQAQPHVESPQVAAAAPLVARETVRLSTPSSVGGRTAARELAVAHALESRTWDARQGSSAAPTVRGENDVVPANPSASSTLPDAGPSSASSTDFSVAVADALSSTPSTQAGRVIRGQLVARRAIELLSTTLTDSPSHFAPAGAPAMALPSGLGGFVAASHKRAQFGQTLVARQAPSRLQGAHPNGRPFVSVAPATVVQAPRAPQAALAAVSETLPRPVVHVGWADRWLARFAGASPAVVATMGTSREMVRRAASAPRPVYMQSVASLGYAAGRSVVSPAARSVLQSTPSASLSTPSLVPQSSPSLVPQSSPSLVPQSTRTFVQTPQAPVQADDAIVPDEMFAAITKAAVQSRSTGDSVSASRPAAALSVAPSRDEAPLSDGAVSLSAFERALVASPLPVGPGMTTRLAASPIAPMLAGVIGSASASQTSSRSSAGFDVRAIAPAVWADMMLSTGAFVDDVPVLRSARSAPTSAYLSPPTGGEHRSRPVGYAELAATVAPTPRTGALATTSPAMVGVHDSRRAFDAELVTAMARTPHRAASTTDALRAAPIVQPGRRPGAFAVRAEAWSAARQADSADLSLDFVSPELVVAAGHYGFGAAQAVQAARLAAAGESTLAGLAYAVDLTLLSALQGQQSAAHSAHRGTPQATIGTPVRPDAAAKDTTVWADAVGRTLNGARSTPRGAVLWPQATVKALELSVGDAEGTHPHALAALDLLAAAEVVSAGTQPAQVHSRFGMHGEGGESLTGAAHGREPLTGAAHGGESLAGAAHDGESLTGAAHGREPLTGVGAFPVVSPTAQVFASMLLSSQTGAPTGSSLSPSVRVARAFGVSQHVAPEGAGLSNAQRAQLVWKSMPIVMGGAQGGVSPVASAVQATSKGSLVANDTAAGAVMPFAASVVSPDASSAVSHAPGLRHVVREGQSAPQTNFSPRPVGSARQAGEWLRALVSPRFGADAGSAAQQVGEMLGSIYNMPVSPELVRTGGAGSDASRPMHPASSTGAPMPAGARNVTKDVPPWFAEAARRVFNEGGSHEGLTIAEMTLIETAPVSQIAADHKSAEHSTGATKPARGASSEIVGLSPEELEELSEECFKELKRKLSVALWRNGDIYG